MEAQKIADRQLSKNVGGLSETTQNSRFSNDIKKLTETVSVLIERINNNLQNGRRSQNFRSENGNN